MDKYPNIIFVGYLLISGLLLLLLSFSGFSIAYGWAMNDRGSSISHNDYSAVSAITDGKVQLSITQAAQQNFPDKLDNNTQPTKNTSTQQPRLLSSKLMVIVDVIGGGPLTPSDITVSVSGNNVSPSKFQGQSSPGTIVTLDEGRYYVSSTQSLYPGYTVAYSADCSSIVRAGDAKTCEITYGYGKAVLYVTKEAFGGPLKPQDFSIVVNGNNPQPSTFAGGIRVPVLLDPGNFEVSEPNVPAGYVVSYSGFHSCKGTLTRGEYLECFVWNDIEQENPKSKYDLGFENGDVTHGWEWGQAQYDDTTMGLRHVDKSQIQPPSPDNDGLYALKSTVQPLDEATNHPTGSSSVKLGARAEVASSNLHFFNDQEYWYHWYTMFPTDLKIPNGPRGHEPFHIFTQVHQNAPSSKCRNPSDNGNPMDCLVIPLGFNIANYTSPHAYPHSDETRYAAIGATLEFSVINKTDVYIDCLNDGSKTPQDHPPHCSGRTHFECPTTLPNCGRGDGGDTLWADKLIRGKWYEFLLHVKWETCINYSVTGRCLNDTGGLVELWVDGKNVVQKTSHFALDDDGDAYLKQGLYHCRHDATINNCVKPFDQTNPPYGTQSIFHDGTDAVRCPLYHPYYHPDTQLCHINRLPYS